MWVEAVGNLWSCGVQEGYEVKEYACGDIWGRGGK